MFKVLEVHSGYVSSALVFIIHLAAAFYFLYILKTSYTDYLPGSTEKKVVWYKAPTTTPEPQIQQPTSYQQPEQVTSPAAAQEVAEVTESVAVNPLRMGRSSADRKSAWTKKNITEDKEPKKLTAATLMDAISTEQATKRQAHAVYTKQEAVKNAAAAQMREISDGRLRHKIFSAAQMAFDMHKEHYIAAQDIISSITLSLILNPQGEIVAVEVLRSTGTKSLDDHIAKIFQSIKKIALPASRNGQDFLTHTFTGGVRIHAGSGHIIFDYKDASGIHIV